MAARGLVNGRGPLRRSGRDSAKRVVSDTIPPGPRKEPSLLCAFYFFYTLYLLEFLDQTVK